METNNLRLEEELTALKAENARLKALDKDIDSSRFEIIFDRSALGNKIINSDLEIIRVNQALIRLLGYDEKELLGALIIDFVHPEHIDRWNKLREELWNHKKPSFSIDTCILRKDGTAVWCHVTSIIFPDNGETLGYTILEDITDRMEYERLKEEARTLQFEIEKKEIENLNQKESIALVLETQENERKRIAESLHNGIGQLLFGVKLSLERIRPGIDTDENNSGYLKQSKYLLDDAIKESRRISHELTPSVLEDYGLKLALEDLAAQFRGTVSIQCRTKGSVENLHKFLATAIFRIAQELVLNIVKHASARSAKIILARAGDIITLTVEDDGLGFNTDTNSDGIGLRTMRSKVILLNGTMQYTSKANSGTRVVITLPVNMKGRK